MSGMPPAHCLNSAALPNGRCAAECLGDGRYGQISSDFDFGACWFVVVGAGRCGIARPERADFQREEIERDIERSRQERKRIKAENKSKNAEREEKLARQREAIANKYRVGGGLGWKNGSRLKVYNREEFKSSDEFVAAKALDAEENSLVNDLLVLDATIKQTDAKFFVAGSEFIKLLDEVKQMKVERAPVLPRAAAKRKEKVRQKLANNLFPDEKTMHTETVNSHLRGSAVGGPVGSVNLMVAGSLESVKSHLEVTERPIAQPPQWTIAETFKKAHPLVGDERANDGDIFYYLRTLRILIALHQEALEKRASHDITRPRIEDAIIAISNLRKKGAVNPILHDREENLKAAKKVAHSAIKSGDGISARPGQLATEKGDDLKSRLKQTIQEIKARTHSWPSYEEDPPVAKK